MHKWHTFHIAGATIGSCGSCGANALLVLVSLGKSGFGSAGGRLCEYLRFRMPKRAVTAHSGANTMGWDGMGCISVSVV